MATTSPSAALVPVRPVLSTAERLALAGFLAGYSGLTRQAYELDLRQYATWCQTRHLALFSSRRADIECFARDLEARGRARATITRRLCTIAGLYRYAVEEELLDHSPAVHVRRPRLDYESHATALDRNELGALLVVAGLGPPAEHALISLLALNGLRVSEATGADIEAMGIERGHRTLVITRKGGKVVTIPLAPRTARAIDLVVGERCEGPVFLTPDGRRLDRHGAGRIVRRARPPRRDLQARRAPHPAPRLHHRRPGRRRAAAGRAGSRLPRRPAHHHALRPGQGLPRPARHLHRRRLRCWSSSVALHSAPPTAWPARPSQAAGAMPSVTQRARPPAPANRRSAWPVALAPLAVEVRRSGQCGAAAVSGRGCGFRRGRFCSTAGE